MKRMRGGAQGGFSLVELMVATTITMLLSTGLISLLMSTRGNSLAQSAMDQFQDDERLVLTRLADTVQNAGYFTQPLNYSGNVALALPASGSFGAGQGLYGTVGTGGAADSVQVRYLSASGDGLLDCAGGTNTSGANTVITNQFTVDGAGNFNCTTNGTTVTLASGVTAFTVQYGVDTNGDGSADQYVNANGVTGGSGWGAVMSVKVTLAFLNPLAGQPGATLTAPTVVQVIPLLNRI